jgi:ABC-type transport system involved in multi-copper enzyme maturation permease subunit
MKRLLWKEIRSSLPILVLATAIMAWLLIIGDSCWFREVQHEGGYTLGVSRCDLFVIVFLVLGLQTYSAELGKDTMRFLYSQPIKWWQIWFAKLLVGVVAALFIVLMSGEVYAATAPEQYRPFVHDGLAHGIYLGLEILIVAYLIGMSASALMPGIALSFAALIIAVAGFSLSVWLVAIIGALTHIHLLADIAGEMNGPLMLLGPICMLPAGILLARALPRLSPKQRWITWIRVPAVVCAFAAACGAVHYGSSIPGQECETLSMMGYDLSPNGDWATYGTYRGGQHGHVRNLSFVSTKTGRIERTWPATSLVIDAWSPDSDRCAYLDSNAELSCGVEYCRCSRNTHSQACGALGNSPRAARPDAGWFSTADVMVTAR